MFLADFQHHEPAIAWTNARPWTKRFLPPIFLVVGLLVASYPEDHAEYTRWSHALHIITTYIMPDNYDKPRFMTSLGLQLIVMGIHFSPRLKDLLSNKYFLWLGKNSFAVYLLHGTLLRWWLVWALYGTTMPQDFKNEKGEMQKGPKLQLRSWPYLVFWIPIWFVAMYFCADLWTKFVDPMCARWTVAIEKYVWKDVAASPQLPTTTKREDVPVNGLVVNGHVIVNGATVEPKRP